ncbi:MAG: hypothetical protein ACXAB7_19985, partial [Candidatus Kariarchaeaceae archaeon]
MVLNWTVEVILIFLSSIPLFVSSYLLFNNYSYHRDRALLAMAIAWLAFGFHTFFVAMAYFLLFKPLFVFRIIFLVVLAYALEVALGIINTSRVDPIRLSIVTLISGFVSYFALLSDAVEDYEFPNGDKSLTSALNFRWAVNILGVYLSLSYLYYTYKIYHNSPPNLLKYAR